MDRCPTVVRIVRCWHALNFASPPQEQRRMQTPFFVPRFGHRRSGSSAREAGRNPCHGCTLPCTPDPGRGARHPPPCPRPEVSPPPARQPIVHDPTISTNPMGLRAKNAHSIKSTRLARYTLAIRKPHQPSKSNGKRQAKARSHSTTTTPLLHRCRPPARPSPWW